MEVTPVGGPRDLAAFIRLPFEIYRDDPHWVAPLDSDEKVRLTPGKNPFFEHGEAALFLARANGRVAGRIAASIDRNHDRVHGERQGAFGFFEATSSDAASALLAAAETWARGKGATVARGPLSFTTNDECGLLVDGFDRSQPLLMPYNRPDYAGWIEAAGYRKAKDLYSFTRPGPYDLSSAFKRVADMARRRAGVTTRPLDMKNFPSELALVKGIYNSAWEKNWGFVPMTDAEIDHMAKQLKPAVIPDFVRFAEVDGKAVAFLLYVPDVNLALKPARGKLFPFGVFHVLFGLPKIREGRLMALGVVPEYRRTGLAPTLVSDLGEALDRRGYTNSHIGWTLEDNDIVNHLIVDVGAKRSVTHRIYEKPLGA
ncbi:MAG TPA: N-acetyltransferase [Candidatus Eisenbacteria bacterium]|nr:N-acetyltransferase [Candidatus Eisenbacteria bacterium]